MWCKRNFKYTKEQTERYRKTMRLDCNRCGAPDWFKQHDCFAKGRKCIKCGKMRHHAKYCRSTRKINHIADEETYSADEDDWTPDRIQSIQQKIKSMEKKSKNGPQFYTKLQLVNNRPIKIIVATLIPKAKFNNIQISKWAVQKSNWSY